MSLRLSSGLRNHIAQRGSVKRAFQNGALLFYSGSQPATADAAATGTLLCTYTDASGARTKEVRATGTVTLTGGASGSIDTVTVNSVNIIPNGAVPYNTSLNQTAADLATAINESMGMHDYSAEASGAIVTIKAPLGFGANANTWVVTATLTTITASYANMASGVNPVNGLKFGVATAGELVKLASQVWSGVAAASGIAGWFRFVGAVDDPLTLDSSAAYLRLDGSVGTSGADLNGASTSIVAGATQTIGDFDITVPTL
jgi:hypothetical protein